MHYFFYVLTVFIGCCSNVFFLELLIKAFPGSGNLITFAQFVFISVKGFIFESKFGTKPTHIPIKKYASLVILFFVVSVLNNYALNFNISMPLHMIFRSGSLIANMILGILILKKRYCMREYVSIVMITAGIFICTLASSNDIKSASKSTVDANTNGAGSNGTVNTDDEGAGVNELVEYARWLVGILMLTVALLLSASMGIIQETLYKQYGKHPGEALYYNHVLTLPAFAFFYKDLQTQVALFNASEQLVDLVVVTLPLIWFYLICNTLTQYVCISSVFVLTTECTSLTVTLVVTLRKFTSLILSIIYFQNPFTLWHWAGTILVFAGTFMFSNAAISLCASLARRLGKLTNNYNNNNKKIE